MVGAATLKALSAVTVLVRHKGRPVAGSQRSTWQIVANKIAQIRWSRPPATIECEYSDLENDPLFDREPVQIPSGS